MKNEKVEDIKELINALFGDTSQPPEDTLECMEEIAATVEMNMNALNDDLHG